MSKQKYCPSCGAGSPLSANFCTSCGTGLNSLTPKTQAKAEVQTQQFTPIAINRNQDDERIDHHFELRLNKLEVEINKTPLPFETVGNSILGSNVQPHKISPLNAIDNNKVMEELRNRVRPLKPKETSFHID